MVLKVVLEIKTLLVTHTFHGAKKLYWLLPPLYYHSFTKKSPQDIEQYAVLIPYPE
jgi:hypothetical protein